MTNRKTRRNKIVRRRNKSCCNKFKGGANTRSAEVRQTLQQRMVAVTEEAQNCRRELEGKDSEIVALRAELVGREADIRDRDQEITRLRGMLPVHHPVIAERISPPVQHHRGVVTSEIVPEGVVAHPVSPDRQGSFVEGERVPQQPIQSRMLRRLSRMRIVPVPGSGTSNMKKKKKSKKKKGKGRK